MTELAFGKVEAVFEGLDDLHTDVMASVEEGFHEFAESGNAVFGRPFTWELSIFGATEVEMLLVEVILSELCRYRGE